MFVASIDCFKMHVKKEGKQRKEKHFWMIFADDDENDKEVEKKRDKT